MKSLSLTAIVRDWTIGQKVSLPVQDGTSLLSELLVEGSFHTGQWTLTVQHPEDPGRGKYAPEIERTIPNPNGGIVHSTESMFAAVSNHILGLDTYTGAAATQKMDSFRTKNSPYLKNGALAYAL